MKKTSISNIILLLFGFLTIQINAQTASSSDNIVARQIADRSVPFDVTATGVSKTVQFGADLAWANEQAFRRNILFMGLNQIDIVRASFQPTYPLVNGTGLTSQQITDLDYRLYLINTYVGANTTLALNCDHPSVDPWYVGYPSRWHQLIKTSAQRYKNAGHNIITVGAFNEPDYGWGQGSNQDMYDITSLMKNDSFFNNIRLSGGNTLNCDAAQGWYDYLRPAGVNEGNTHQLAGSFDGYASFYQNVRANGHHATADELHNIVEALVGYEYGMQTGIWWADIDLASGEMVKAFDGQRLGYAEHRPNWTAAAVYRAPDGKVQAFGGTSERQAATTTYNYISKDRVVYYDGQGPSHEFVLEMPGGSGYSNGQTNAERVINITYGDDIQPVINGEYMIVNRSNGQVMQISGRAKDGLNVLTGSYSGSNQQHWQVQPVDSRIGGDFSYFRINPSSSNRHTLDLYGYNLNNGGNIDIWTTGSGGNNQWYLDYADDGYFYIRSRESSKCVVLESGGTNVSQWEKITGDYKQQWRLLPVGAPIEFVAPNAPTNLVAIAQTASNKLTWTASSSNDVAGYTILRATTSNGAYNTIARNLTSTAFIDNTALTGVQYFYKIRAVDNSLNRSAYSNTVSVTATGANTIVQQLDFEDNLNDASINLNKAAIYGSATYGTGKVGAKALTLNGSSNFVQLPAEVANHQQITVASWVKWSGGNALQRVFDFGNGQAESMYLTTNNSSGNLQFTIYNAGTNYTLTAPAIVPNSWTHLAVTLGSAGVKIYVNGQMVAQGAAPSINPLTLKPVLNYIGRSQWSDALFNGSVDDFRIYNYPLSAQEVANLAGVVTGNTPPTVSITSPTNGSSYAQGTNVTITANASDADGSVSQVEFFVNGLSIGTDTTSPYSMNWTVGSGSFALTAVATDNQSATTASAGVNVTGTCAGSTITPYYQINYGAWVIGTNITINQGDVLILGPQPISGGSWAWSGCGTSGTSREQTLNLTSSCSATATHTNDCGGVSSGTYNITVNSGSSTSMKVQSIVIGTATAGKGKKYGTASVTITDNLGNPVSGATVSGTFSGTFSQSVSGVTNSSGVVNFQTSGSAGGAITVNFCVDNVTKSGLTYNSSQNVITCTGGTAKIADLGSDKSGIEFSVYPNPTSDYVTINLAKIITGTNN